MLLQDRRGGIEYDVQVACVRDTDNLDAPCDIRHCYRHDAWYKGLIVFFFAISTGTSYPKIATNFKSLYRAEIFALLP